MPPVKNSSSENLSVCISTAESYNSKSSVSTAALLHNASMRTPRTPRKNATPRTTPRSLAYDQIREVSAGSGTDVEKCDQILSNYRQEDVVFALMTHLKEREGELRRITEQRNLSLKLKMAADTANQQLQGALTIQRNLLDAKELTIKSLEDKLERSEKIRTSSAASPSSRSSEGSNQGRIKELSDEVACLHEEREKVKDAYQKVLTDKDETIAELKTQVEELNAKMSKSDKNTSGSSEKTDTELETNLADTKKEVTNLKNELEEMEKVIKRKDWMISSMRQENEDQRHREDNLHAHIKTLQQTIDTYETKFMGKGTDVPMVLAKLSDSEVRNKELAETMCQMEIQMSVMRMEFRKHGLDLEKVEMDFPVKNGNGNDDLEERQPPSIDDGNMADNEDEDGDTATLDSVLVPYDPFGNADKDDLSLLKQDINDGIENIMDGGFCRCACTRGIETREDEPGPEVMDIDAVYTDASASETFDTVEDE